MIMVFDIFLDPCKFERLKEPHRQQLSMQTGAALSNIADILSISLNDFDARKKQYEKDVSEATKGTPVATDPIIRSSTRLPGLDRPFQYKSSLERHTQWFEEKCKQQQEEAKQQSSINEPSTSSSSSSKRFKKS